MKTKIISFLVLISVIFLTGCAPISNLTSDAEECKKAGGTWLADYNECEYVGGEWCEKRGGKFFECESACRHNPEAEICTMQCVIVCKLPGGQAVINNFEDCINAGNPAMESYPRQCRAGDRTFTEVIDIPN